MYVYKVFLLRILSVFFFVNDKFYDERETNGKRVSYFSHEPIAC